MFIVNNKNLFFALSGLIVAASLFAVFHFGLKFGIDFTGGTYIKVQFIGARPTVTQMNEKLAAEGLVEFSAREAGTQGYDVRVAESGADVQQKVTQAIATWNAYQGQVTEVSQIGPTIGAELRNKSYAAIGLVLLCILLFIAFVFRKVSNPVSSWVYGMIALITLVHDVVVPTGFYALLGHYSNAQIDTLFVTAILTVLGFSIHDTIVVFDRVRENLRRNHEAGRKEDFAETAGKSLGQTLIRSTNTSLTVVITLAALYWFGPVSTEYFALTLLVGIIAGTYSSIFLATPLLVWWAQRKQH
ncbi:protein translocase subunit SecF [bacterium]|nr:protein translocase subunit SecF [bacterium]